MEKKISILCDIDDTITDTLGAFLKLYNEKYNDNKIKADYKTYVSLEGKFFKAPMSEIFYGEAAKETYKELKVDYLTIRVINLLMADKNVNFKFLTARTEDLRELTTNWLNNIFINFKEEDLIMDEAKHNYHADIIIDDRFDHLENSSCKTKICMTGPYNENKILDGDFYRVYSWAGIYKILKKKGIINYD